MGPLSLVLSTLVISSSMSRSDSGLVSAFAFRPAPHTTRRVTTTSSWASPREDGAGDDGWGDAPLAVDDRDGGDLRSSPPPAGSEPAGDMDRRLRELRALREEAADKAAAPRSSSSSPDSGGERDLFIPIFAAVSIAGFVGAYGYETLRLANEGALYLPKYLPF